MNLQLRLNLRLARIRLYLAKVNNHYSALTALKLITT